MIGENTKETDVEVNPTKEKHLTNVRAAGHEEKIVLTPPQSFTVEEAISYIRGNFITNYCFYFPSISFSHKFIYILTVFTLKMLHPLKYNWILYIYTYFYILIGNEQKLI